MNTKDIKPLQEIPLDISQERLLRGLVSPDVPRGTLTPAASLDMNQELLAGLSEWWGSLGQVSCRRLSVSLERLSAVPPSKADRQLELQRARGRRAWEKLISTPEGRAAESRRGAENMRRWRKRQKALRQVSAPKADDDKCLHDPT